MSATAQPHDPLQIAKMLIEAHGLRATAVAQSHAEEARLAGETAELDRWLAVQSAIAELKQASKPAQESMLH
jgi:hypothetical protein